jgi:hypothetical protein
VQFGNYTPDFELFLKQKALQLLVKLLCVGPYYSLLTERNLLLSQEKRLHQVKNPFDYLYGMIYVVA